MNGGPIVARSVAVGWGLALAVAAYALMRGIQSLTAPDPDPAAVAWSVHSGFFWRVWTASFVGGLGAFTTYLVARDDPRRAARAMGPALAGASLLLALQSLFFP